MKNSDKRKIELKIHTTVPFSMGLKRETDWVQKFIAYQIGCHCRNECKEDLFEDFIYVCPKFIEMYQAHHHAFHVKLVNQAMTVQVREKAVAFSWNRKRTCKLILKKNKVEILRPGCDWINYSKRDVIFSKDHQFTREHQKGHYRDTAIQESFNFFENKTLKDNTYFYKTRNSSHLKLVA